MTTNIIIPVYNRPEHTKQTLDSLIQNTSWENARLFIINDDSSAETTDLLEKYEAFVGVTGGYIHRNNVNIGPGASRNQMVRYIVSEHGKENNLIYHSDNDVFFLPNWLSKLLDIYVQARADGVVLLGASCHPYLQDKTTKHYLVNGREYIVGIKDAVSGYSQLISVEDWLRFGEFSESMREAKEKIMGSEDWEYCQRINEAGLFAGSVVPELIVPTGKTNTYGNPATGAETFLQREGIKVI